jgi:hypothetical protein
MKTYLTHKSIFEKVIDFMARTIPYKEYEPKTEYKSKPKYKPAVFPPHAKKVEFDFKKWSHDNRMRSKEYRKHFENFHNLCVYKIWTYDRP